MKLALIGYGKMGKIIERIALERGHEIVSKIDINNLDDFESEAFASADVAIEFTAPSVAVQNYRRAWKAGVRVVSGTTGWTNEHPELMQEIVDNGHTLFWASNFSIGVNIFFELNKHLARIMNNFPAYDVEMTEVHHTQKLDAPSGTAITLAEGILENIDRKNNWALDTVSNAEEMKIKAIREGQVPGIHTIRYESAVDSIEMTHDAKSREGFALGAVVAAEFTQGKSGFLGMADLMKF